jgi:PAS domain S-box-containing protein
MPTLRIRSVKIALGIALGVLLVPLVLTLQDLLRGGGGAAWLRIVALSAALGSVVFALGRQHAVGSQLAERARLDEERRASDAMFAGILAIAADAVVTVDEEHRIIHFNKGAEEIFGWPAADVIGQPLDVLLPERFRPRHDAFIDEFARSAESARRMGHRREVAGRRRDGSEFPAEASISKLDLPGGRRVFTAVVRDATERRRAQENERFLAEAGARLAASLDYDEVLQTVADAAVPALGDASFVDVANGSELMRRFGIGTLSEDPAAHRALAELARRGGLTWDSPSLVLDVMRRSRAELVEVIDDAWLEAHEESAELVSLWQASGVQSMLIVPLTVGDRTIGAITLLGLDDKRDFNTDIRPLADKFAALAALALENARLYRVAQQATEGRDQVLGVVSHDLRNPISAIAMCASALQGSAPMSSEKRESLLLTITQSTQWMNRLIQDLLDVTSIEAGRLSLERDRTAVPTLVAGAVRMFEVEASHRNIQLACHVDENLPLVTADGSRIIQVLGNLLGNALKFTPDGGRITVRAEAQDRDVVIAVSDTGAGIPPEDQSRVFDRYWHARRTAKKRGTGLGLSIAKGIVQAHGGRIWLESVPGHGSTFSFSIPVEPAGVGVSRPS